MIASEADPNRDEVFGEDDYRELAAVLERFYSLVLTDCGPGLLHSVMRVILPAADQLIVVAAPSLDGARSASLTLDWLERHGYRQLARSSVVVINAVRERGLVDVDKLQQHFRPAAGRWSASRSTATSRPAPRSSSTSWPRRPAAPTSSSPPRWPTASRPRSDGTPT